MSCLPLPIEQNDQQLVIQLVIESVQGRYLLLTPGTHAIDPAITGVTGLKCPRSQSVVLGDARRSESSDRQTSGCSPQHHPQTSGEYLSQARCTKSHRSDRLECFLPSLACKPAKRDGPGGVRVPQSIKKSGPKKFPGWQHFESEWYDTSLAMPESDPI